MALWSYLQYSFKLGMIGEPEPSEILFEYQWDHSFHDVKDHKDPKNAYTRRILSTICVNS